MSIESFGHNSGSLARSRRGSYPIPLTTPATAGFLGRTERGPVNEPLCIESFPEYCRYFGSHFPGGAVSYAVQDFFLHGGKRAVIVRVTNRASRARIEIPAGDGMLRLRARYPGRHEILRVSIDYEQLENEEEQFNLIVQRLGTASAGLVEDQEIYPMVSVRRGDARYLGSVLEKSRLIALAGAPPAERPEATPPDRPGAPVRYISATTPGDDGAEVTDYDIIGSDRDGTGLFAFLRGPRPDLLAIPLPPDHDLGSTAFVAAARYCEQNRALFIWDPPSEWASVDAALLGSRRLGCSSANVVAYFPRVRPRGTAQRQAIGIPASGAIAGMLARRGQRGLWGKTQDTDYVLRAALTPMLELSESESHRLARYGFNTFRASPRSGTHLVGGVTQNGGSLGSGTNANLEIRRLGLFVLSSVEEAAMLAVGESDPHVALVRLEGQVRRFFDDLYLRDAFVGRTASQAYYLHAAAGSNGAERELRFGFALSAPGRFAEYRVGLAGANAGRVERVRVVEAEQLFS